MYALIKNNPISLLIRKNLFEKKFMTHENVNYFRGIYNSFGEAAASAPKTKPIGYDNQKAALLYQERTQQVYSTDYPVLYWMQKYKDNIKRIFDFGGHIGIHFYSYADYLKEFELQEWTVCDVESVVNVGRELANEKQTQTLNFVTNINKCEDYDLFIANGSLQYLDWELHEQLKQLSGMPKLLLVNMLPLHPSEKSITLQSIGSSYCPYYLRKENEFISGLQAIGYELVDSWKNEEKKCNIAFEPNRSLSYYSGAFFILTNL